MPRVSLLLIALLSAQAVFADEPTPTQASSPSTIAKLNERIEQLEKRIAELEAQRALPGTTELSSNGGSFKPRYLPTPNQPILPNTKASPRYRSVAPQTLIPPQPTLPENWKPFRFNGMEYYTILIHGVKQLNSPQGNDSPDQ